MSNFAYGKADLVTSLYEQARELQTEVGCPPEKIRIIPNGIRVEEFQDIPGKKEEDKGRINIGAMLRVTPVKDIITMIQAFGFAKEREPSLKLWIMGSWDEDQEYAKGCFELVQIMGVADVVFTGKIKASEYYGRMDMTLLTSISEGQPLTILESFAAKKPVIATDVGNCRGLILGERDDFGAAGIVTRIMNVQDIAQAMVYLAHNEQVRLQMGENGYRRVKKGYQFRHMQDAYKKIYREFAEDMKLEWKEPQTDSNGREE